MLSTHAMAINVANQADWNTAVAAVGAAGANSTVTINITSGFTLSGSLAELQAANSNVTVNITGNGQTIDGAASFQGIVVNGANAPTVNISSLAISNTAAIGGNGTNGQAGYFSPGLSYGSGGGGGGGLGAGGGLFVGSGANVTLTTVTFTGNTATGGTGGTGGSAQNTAADPVNGGNGGTGGAANNGGASGGGGTGGTGGHTGTQGTGGATGSFGAGGGGGGGSGTTSSTSYTINNAGGAGNANGGTGGSGGDGVTNNGGSQGPGSDGGFGGAGGSANGGAIYVASGGTLTILNSGISGAAAVGGSGGSSGIGQGPSAFNGSAGAAGGAAGSGIFIGGVTANIGVTAGTVTYANTIGGTGLTTGGVNTAIIKTGIGTLVLQAANTYTGNTVVDGGTLEVNGSAVNSALTTVNSGGRLTGVGTVRGSQINAGGTFAPGSGTAASTMSVNGNLAFQSGAIYLIQVDPNTASRANVSGTATLNGAAVTANYANGTYIAKKYTILNATGGVSGTFSGVTNTNLPSGFSATLSYDSNNAFLDLAMSSSGNVNQQNVSNALSNYFNTNGSIPIVFTGLTPTGLTQISGETAIGSQQTTFNAMTQFMGVMTDPYAGGRGEQGPGPTGAIGYAEETLAYAAKRNPNDALAAIYTKAPAAPVARPSWSIWAAGFGGSQTTDGNSTALGSNNTTSNVYGTAVGADYRFSPSTIAGFSMAGGGTTFSVANGGSGRSDLFQAGGFVRHNIGAAYITGALAYGWQHVTTNRTVTVAGVDQLRASFDANTISGRLEGGYRFISPWIGFGITPYAAAQFTNFNLPDYAESAVTGANTFALRFGSQSVTDTRSELGLRTDKAYALADGMFTLRSRFAWAYDFNPGRSVGATFQTLPGASFVVNGARQAQNSALTTLAAEMKWKNGWSAGASFEGEFSDVTLSYAGKGIVRYTW